MRSKAHFSWQRLLCAGLALSCVPSLALAGKDYEDHPGYVDGSEIAALAGENGGLVEVSIHGPLLRQVASALSNQHEAIGSFLEGIVAVSAVVVEQPRDSAEAKRRVDEIGESLSAGDWQRIARVRESNEDVWVFVIYDDDGENLNGLTVLVRETNEIVFVNLAGTIDLEMVGEFGLTANIPGLDELLDEDISRELRRYERKSKGKERKTRKMKKRKDKEDGRSESDDGGAR